MDSLKALSSLPPLTCEVVIDGRSTRRSDQPGCICLTDPIELQVRQPDPRYVTVDQLAAMIGQTVGSTRRLLRKGLIPGARRKDPTASRSPWLIPADAAERYLGRWS